MRTMEHDTGIPASGNDVWMWYVANRMSVIRTGSPDSYMYLYTYTVGMSRATPPVGMSRATPPRVGMDNVCKGVLANHEWI